MLDLNRDWLEIAAEFKRLRQHSVDTERRFSHFKDKANEAFVSLAMQHSDIAQLILKLMIRTGELQDEDAGLLSRIEELERRADEPKSKAAPKKGKKR